MYKMLPFPFFPLVFTSSLLEFCGCRLFLDLCCLTRLTAAWSKPGKRRVGMWKIPDPFQQVNYGPCVITSMWDQQERLSPNQPVCLLLLCQGISIICPRTALCRCKCGIEREEIEVIASCLWEGMHIWKSRHMFWLVWWSCRNFIQSVPLEKCSPVLCTSWNWEII